MKRRTNEPPDLPEPPPPPPPSGLLTFGTSGNDVLVGGAYADQI